MALSAFADKAHPPLDAELRATLGASHRAWARLVELVAKELPPTVPEWGFSGAKSGWGLRLRRRERVLLYMTPARGKFLVSFALGEKAVRAAHAGGLPASVLEVIEAAPRYAEGRGVRFEVRTVREVAPLAALARIKHEH